MPIRPSVKSIEGNLLYIDEGGNLVLDTIGKITGQIQSGVPPQFLVRGGATPGGGGLLSSGVISLSSAQLLDLANKAVEIIPAPGLNKGIIVTEVLSAYNFNTLDYPSLTPVLIYGANESVSYNADIAPFLGLAESAVLNSTFEGNNFTKAIAANASVNLKVISGDPSVGSGDGTGTIEVFYRIVSWA